MTHITHDEIQELLGAFALDAVDGEEYEVVEMHLRTCPRCRAEVADHREIAAVLAQGGARAPEGVWDRIVGAIEPAPPPMRLELTPPEVVAPVISLPDRAKGSSRWNHRLLAVAAAVVILVLGAAAARLTHRVDRLQNQIASAQLDNVASRALTAPGTRRTQLKAPHGSVTVTAAVTVDGEGFLMAGTTPTLSGGHTYQLWGVVGKNTISLGTFDGGANVVAFRVSPKVKALAVTEEESGGVVSSKNSAVFSATI